MQLAIRKAWDFGPGTTPCSRSENIVALWHGWNKEESYCSDGRRCTQPAKCVVAKLSSFRGQARLVILQWKYYCHFFAWNLRYCPSGFGHCRNIVLRSYTPSFTNFFYTFAIAHISIPVESFLGFFSPRASAFPAPNFIGIGFCKIFITVEALFLKKGPLTSNPRCRYLSLDLAVVASRTKVA